MTVLLNLVANVTARSSVLNLPAVTRLYNALPRFQRAYLACKALQSNSTFAIARTYATAGPKKGSTAATKKPSTRKPVAKKTPKKAVKAKAKPKAKKKVVKKRKVLKKKKPVVKKKVLTEKQKEKKARNALLEEIKDLKIKALEPPAPKSVSPITLFVKQQKGLVSGPDALKQVQDKWKTVSASEREELERAAAHNSQENKMLYHNWILQHTPQQIRDANKARLSLRLRLPKLYPTRKLKNGAWGPLKDERQVKRPMNSFLIYSTERKSAFKGQSVIEASKLIAAEFKELSASERKQYDDLAEADKARYAREYMDTFGEAPPSPRVRVPRTVKTT